METGLLLFVLIALLASTVASPASNDVNGFLHYLKNTAINTAANPSQAREHQESVELQRVNTAANSGFRLIYSLDMRNRSQSCPTNLKLHQSDGLRLCGRKTDGACDSVIIPTDLMTYRYVRGQITAYQWSTPDAFNTGVTSIDGTYVDGISITHGSNPRKHIWTLAVGLSQYRSNDQYNCPGAGSDNNAQPQPAFVKNNYFCSSAFEGSGYPYNTLLDTPLWTDGADCAAQCPRSGPRIFCAKLSAYTTDDIELRVCADQDRSNEDIRIQKIDLYISD